MYFLLGELPIEAALHLDILSLFWNIWINPQTKAHEVVKYLLKMSDSSSLTWSAHVRIVFLEYNLPDPLMLLDSPPWPKDSWKNYTKIAVTSKHEASLRQKSRGNYKLNYLNVQATGLLGRPHPVVSWVLTTHDVLIVRPHLKMLSGDYLCYAHLAHDRGDDPHCRMCQQIMHHPAPAEDMVHLLTRCRGTADTRGRVIPDLLNTLAQLIPKNSLLFSYTNELLTQFMLDCTSLNLPVNIRVPPSHPGFNTIARQCSTVIYAIHKDRSRQMKAMSLLI